MIEIYTDGSCLPNPGPIGCAIVVLKNGQVTNKKSWEIGIGTAKEAEIYGLIRALEHVRDIDDAVTIWIDNAFVQSGYYKCVDEWRTNGFVGPNGKRVEYLDLWAEVINLWKDTVTVNIISGNTDNKYHIMADRLAKNAMRGMAVDLKGKRSRNNKITRVQRLNRNSRKVILRISRKYTPVENDNVIGVGKKLGHEFILGPIWIGRDKVKKTIGDTHYVIIEHGLWMSFAKNDVFKKNRELWSAEFHNKSRLGSWKQKRSS